MPYIISFRVGNKEKKDVFLAEKTITNRYGEAIPIGLAVSTSALFAKVFTFSEEAKRFIQKHGLTGGEIREAA